MKRSVSTLGMVLLCAAAISSGQEKTPSTPAAAIPAVRKYQAAVRAADAERTRAVEKARAILIADLKAAQKDALQHDDLDAATRCAVMAKEKAEPAITVELLQGSVWNVKGDHIRLNADGTFTHSDPRFGGTWTITGERTITVVFNHGYVNIWKFDREGKAFKALQFIHDGEYDGTLAR